MAFLDFFKAKLAALRSTETSAAPMAPGETARSNSEVGFRSQDMALALFQRRMWVDARLMQTIQDIRRMDASDGRIKKIHSRCARAAAKGGLRLVVSAQPRLEREWKLFRDTLGLNNPQKLQSDLRGLLVDGNLALQWVLDDAGLPIAGVRMPPETLRANTTPAGVFADAARAYTQIDPASGREVASFGLWQLTVGRLDPVSFDDWGSPGRPYLDASRTVWRKLDMTEEDAVLRRHMRAPQRMAHVLEGASESDLATYRAGVENAQGDGNFTDYYLNRKGSVSAVAGDANLEQIADVVHLLDTFLSASPMSKGLLGYTAGLNRDILEDLKKDWYDELAALQTVAAAVYKRGFVLWLLLRGINPQAYDFDVAFAERITDSPNQRADLGLKLQALGASKETVFETAGLNAQDERKALDREREEVDPYPLDGDEVAGTPPRPGTNPNVTVTPGNARKGDSATNISTRTKP